MKIDWFTLIAQVINFLVLMWLLKHYLYKPILKAIDERENKIKEQLMDAENKKMIAENEQEEFRQKNEAFDNQKDELTEKMIADVNEERHKMTEQARKEVNDLKTKLEKALMDEQELKGREISKQVTEEALAIARKVLSDISSTTLEKETVNTFIQKVSTLSTNEKKELASALQSKSEKIYIKSAFELSGKQREDIEKSLADALSVPKTQFKFDIAPELISGIELTAKGYKLSWSLSEYVHQLEKQYLQ